MNYKILYLMHIPWNWVKQRPHFIAENLSRYFDVTVLYQKPFRRRNLVLNSVSNLVQIKEFYGIPFKNRSVLLNLINNFFVRVQFKINNLFNKNKYDIVWITNPEMYQYLKYIIDDKILVYDCMDDALEFPLIKSNKWLFENLYKLEEELCVRSNLIFCSSDYLKNKLVNRYKFDIKKIKTINNGINLDNLYIQSDIPSEIKELFVGEDKKLVYIGTISEWFDFDLVLESLNQCNGIKYLLFGPTEVKIPKHKNLIYYGPIIHEYVSTIMKMSDILVMPFKVNELVKSVNPVKVYEYIYSGKPSLVVKYEETKKFDRYVFLYNSYDDYLETIKNILSNKLHMNLSESEKFNFLERATWQYRVKEMIEILSEHLNN
jgi:teichuronic acid biosynthesis glycosyltransferase TuaH